MRDLEVRAAAYGTAELAFSVEGQLLDGQLVVVYVDGDRQQIVDSGANGASLTGLLEGEHQVKVQTERKFAAWGERHGDFGGKRAWIRWPRSADASTALYRVKMDGDVVAEVSGVVIQARTNVALGDGKGRCSSWGNFTESAPVNLVATITPESDGTYAWEVGEETGEGTFTAGLNVPLPLGLWVQFLDKPEEYDGTAFTVAIGPPTEWLSDALEPEVHEFEVLAVDGAAEGGNESDVIAGRTLRILDPVAAVTCSMEWLPAFPKMQLTAILPSEEGANAIASVRVYANWDSMQHVFRDHVLEDFPVATLARTEDELAPWNFAAGDAEGQLKFYLRPVGEDGRERRDLTLYRFTFPPTPMDLGIVLGEPNNLKLTAAAGGDVVVEWDYRLRPADAVSAFWIYVATTDAMDGWATAHTVVDAAEGVAVGNVLHFRELLALGLATAVVRWIGVLAVTSASVKSVERVALSVVGDATGPAFSGRTFGVNQ